MSGANRVAEELAIYLQLDDGEFVLDAEPAAWRRTARVLRGNLQIATYHWTVGHPGTWTHDRDSPLILNCLETARVRELLSKA